MGWKPAMTLKPAKPPLPIHAGNPLLGYGPTSRREWSLQDHRLLPLQCWSNGSLTPQSTVTIKGGPRVSPKTVDTSSLKVKMVEKCNLSHICCKWMIPAKLTHVTLLPLMSPDNITHSWNSVDSRRREKNESAEPKIILQKQGMTMRPFLHMSAFQLAKTTSWGYRNITTATPDAGCCARVCAEHFAHRPLQIITGKKRKRKRKRLLPCHPPPSPTSTWIQQIKWIKSAF